MAANLEKRLHKIIPEFELNPWERDELFEQLADKSPDLEKIIFKQIAIIWPVSHSLCFAFLQQLEKGLECLSQRQLPLWVGGILDSYEANGLRAANLYMSDVQNNFLCQLQGKNGLEFTKIRPRLLPYIQGLSNKDLNLQPSKTTYTDTNTIFLPNTISFFPDNSSNFLVFKLLATFQWAFIEQDIYCHNHKDIKKLENFLSSFSNINLAKDIYHLLQTAQACNFLQDYLPGLMKDGHIFFNHLLIKRSNTGNLTKLDNILDTCYQQILRFCAGKNPFLPENRAETILHEVLHEDLTKKKIFEAVTTFYSTLSRDLYNTLLVEKLPFQGELRPRQARQARLVRRQENKLQFIKALAILIPHKKQNLEKVQDRQQEKRARITEKEANALPLPQGHKNTEDNDDYPENDPYLICLDDNHIKLPDKLKQLADEISDDLGTVPSSYISSAGKMSGGKGNSADISDDSSQLKGLQQGILYDEWDYRRQGFRKNWCQLIEKKIYPTKGTFINTTLKKYRGQIHLLKRQFEMMRSSHCFVKRQKDGEDIDLNAFIESYTDTKAGKGADERLFIKLQRNQRDIAALFLIDMSSSTEGWIGKALKESLVLLCEALHSLDDRYAIFGFSGMRRTRSEIYHIKNFTDSYTESVQNRIAAISAMDYTRMGPPIRHCSKLLTQVEEKIKLLIILTDGKPEDYDDYKGNYAIEDTRHALLEAKNSGIHPFCISIDHQAQDYLPHLFGEMNYTFINDVKKLPLHLPNIYKILTT